LQECFKDLALQYSATGLSILVAAFPEGKERNRALGVFAAASGSGFAAGMILGGVITTTLGWRWVFDIPARFVNRFGVKPILISGMTLQTIGYLLLLRISHRKLLRTTGTNAGNSVWIWVRFHLI